MTIQVRSPSSKKEFEEYYDLRFRILREPWNQARGSEKDDLEEQSIHLMVTENGAPLSIGRAHLNTQKEAQIRYMVTHPEYQGKGFGSLVLKELERRVKEQGAECIILNSRESAIPFYEKHGFKIIGEAPTMFQVVKHKKMRKDLK
ncbi:MAG: GNAT family N-acetyltransferase [Nanoarchaeota archaeon]